MDVLINRVVDGLTAGSIYACLALAVAVVFKGTRHLNFAQGELAMLSTFVVLGAAAAGLPLWLCPILGVAAGFAIGAVVETALIRPLEAKPAQAIILVTIGLYLMANSLAGVIWGVDPQAFPLRFPEHYVKVAGARVYLSDALTWAALAATALALWLLLTRSSLGLRMRAVASNSSSAALAGIAVDRVNALSWGIGGAIASVAGLLVATSTQLSPSVLTDVFVYALAAATLGGLDSGRGAILAGLAIGLVNELIVQVLPTAGAALKQPIVLGLIVIVLLVRPTGVFGSQKVVRV